VHGGRQVLSTADSNRLFVVLGDGRRAVAKFYKDRIWDTVPDGNTLIFGSTLISLKHTVKKLREARCPYAKNKLDMCSHLVTLWRWRYLNLS